MRPARLIATSLLLGAATTLAVSWGLAAHSAYGPGYTLDHARRARVPDRGEGVGEVMVARHHGPGWVLVESVAREANTVIGADEVPPERCVDGWAARAVLPWGVGGAGGREPWPVPTVWDRRRAHATGWPLPALWHEYTWVPAGGPPPFGQYLTPGAIRIEASRGNPGAWPVDYPRALPLWPAWPGFVVDAALYSALWGAMLMGGGALRRRLRLRRGHCPRCGYDLKHDFAAGCPECGWNRAPAAHRGDVQPPPSSPVS